MHLSKRHGGRLAGLALLALALPLFLAASTSAAAKLTFEDPTGDDNGPGSYVYPTDQVYLPGSFDLTQMIVEDKGGTVNVSLTVRAKLENPWGLASGFSVQMAVIFIDKDHKAGSGHTQGIPGLNIEFLPENAWEKAIIISPQPASKVKDELKKAGALAADIIVPQSVTPGGKTFTAVIKKEDLGGDVSDAWGFQCCLTSNEGFPGPKEILTRRVNEFEGQHRFGGGDEYDGDPHVMDILYPPAKGGADEVKGQNTAMSKFVSGADETKWVLAKLPCVYFGKAAADLPELKTIGAAPAAAAPAAAPAAGEAKAAAAPAAPAKAPAMGPYIKTGALEFKLTTKIFMNMLWSDGTIKESPVFASFDSSGHHGANSEVDFLIEAKATDYASATIRIDNRMRYNYWAQYWSSTGDNLDASNYIKLRGATLRLRPPDWMSPGITQVTIGSSDLGMCNPWTMGRIRYIDRDNANGYFMNGKIGSAFSYDLARVALPALFAGPGWRTRGDTFLNYWGQTGFNNADYVYGAALNFPISDAFSFRLVGDYVRDIEGDPKDTDEHDGTEFVTRFNNLVGSFEFKVAPTSSMELRGVLSYAETTYRDTYDFISQWGGANNMPQKDCEDTAGVLTFEMSNIAQSGFGFALEYFNIGEDFVSIMAARREADVLLTEGFEGDDVTGPGNVNGPSKGYGFDWGGYSWSTRGQSPSTIPDNGECQFTEMAYESVVGWKGGTGIFTFVKGSINLAAEYTMIDYNTNMQDRDMTVYPSSQGIWFANQDRTTNIALVRGKFGLPNGMYLKGKVKLVADEDNQDASTSSDDYQSDKMIYDLGFGFPLISQINAEVGYTLYSDDITLGGNDRSTEKNRLYLDMFYEFGGVKIGYYLENFSGDDWIGDTKYDDWGLTRSRAYVELVF